MRPSFGGRARIETKMTLTNKTDSRIEITWDSLPYGIEPDGTLDADGFVCERLVAAGAVEAPAGALAVPAVPTEKKGKTE